MARVAVTGPFGFTGRALAEHLLAAGHDVVGLTRRSPARDPLAPRLTLGPLNAAQPEAMRTALAGVDVLYNTWWLRFPRDGATFEGLVANTAVLVAAAREAGVRRIVQVSVSRASSRADTPYVRGKAAAEAVVRGSGLEWAVVRPTLTYGRGDILINNLAWALRRLPVFGLPGLGRYRLEPVHVEDVARICCEAADGPSGVTVDAAGPETYEYRELVHRIREAVGSRSVVLPMPGLVVLGAAGLLGRFVGDVVLTKDEIRELTSSLLTSDEPGRGEIRLSDWLIEQGPALGRRWSSELARNYRTVVPFATGGPPLRAVGAEGPAAGRSEDSGDAARRPRT